MPTKAPPMPEAVEIAAGHLRLRWSDGESVLSAAALRAACRCAECRAAMLAGRASAAEGVVVVADAEPVGLYALQLTFGDGHARGIYPWSLLRELGELDRASID